MTDEEIQIMYRDAKNKDEQIKILSQLTLKPMWKIRQILGIKYKKPPKKNSASIYNLWTKEEDELLMLMYNQHKPRKEIYSALKRSKGSVDGRITTLKLTHKKKRKNNDN